ncbi:hypothetical protein KJ815_04935, partial [bacterium]|nr:hypothetical protein [bacterium]
PAPSIADDAFQLLKDQYWSGNVRELRNLVESVLTLEGRVSVLTAAHFRSHVETGVNPTRLPVLIGRPAETLDNEFLLRTLLDLRREVGDIKSLLVAAIHRVQGGTDVSDATKLSDMEREQILRVLEENGGNRRKTARDLAIGERTLYRKLKEYEIL